MNFFKGGTMSNHLEPDDALNGMFPTPWPGYPYPPPYPFQSPDLKEREKAAKEKAKRAKELEDERRRKEKERDRQRWNRLVDRVFWGFMLVCVIYAIFNVRL